MYSVLYVDDDPALLDIGRIYLGKTGHFSVDTAASAGEAIEKIRQQTYDAIISDYQMSEIDGIQFLRHIRQHFKDLPFILFTGRGREEIVIEALNSGADFYLQKGGEPKSQFAELDYKIRTAIERRRVQGELKDSKKQLSDLIDFLPDATFAIDLKGRIIVWNRMMEELTGVPPDAVIGTGDFSHSLPLYEDRRPGLADCIVRADEEPEKEFPNLKRNGDKLIAEMYRPPLRDGNGAYFWHTASPIYDATGKVVGAIESVRDITLRKETEEKLAQAHDELNVAYEQLTATEEELRQNYDELSKNQHELILSEERYRSVVEDQTEFICRFSPDGKLSFVNDAYCRYFNLDREDCIGKPHTVVLPPEDISLMEEQLSQLSPSNPVAAIDHRIIMPSGEVRWQHWSDRAIFDSTGKIIEYQSVGRDTTRQKNAEEKLKLAYEELNVAYEQLTATEEELRQNYDELGKSQTELHSAYEQLTATEEELRQNYDELSKSQQDLIRSEERYRNVVEDQTEFICRFSPDGKLTFVNDAYCRYFNLDREDCIGKPHTVALPPEDIPLMEEQLSQLSPANPVAAIDHRIIMPSGEVRWQHWSDRAIFDHTGKIIEYQSVGRDITDRKRMEQSLDESNKKLNLLSNITRHDILNKLTVLQGSLGLLELEIANPDHCRLISKAIQSSDVIRGQISFTQQYQDIGVQKPRWQNLHSAVTTVCMDDGFTNVSIDHHLEAWEVYADPLLRTVFLNLFENAEMHGGKVTRIAVNGTETPEDLVITVDDDGDGIAPEDKERIFRKGIGKHTGLGLFLVQEVLGITGISIRETGEFGKGARFELHIPMGIYRKSGHVQDR
ncbi:MAG: PAS domain S-box protein [Methanoregula sp.]|nr:PAS domain S-box protein [Methanoregula sp.]